MGTIVACTHGCSGLPGGMVLAACDCEYEGEGSVSGCVGIGCIEGGTAMPSWGRSCYVVVREANNINPAKENYLVRVSFTRKFESNQTKNSGKYVLSSRYL